MGQRSDSAEREGSLPAGSEPYDSADSLSLHPRRVPLHAGLWSAICPVI